MKSESWSVLSFIDWMSSPDRLDEARFESLGSFMLVAMPIHCGTLFMYANDLGWYGKFVFAPLFLLSAVVGLRVANAKPYCLMLNLAVTSLWLVMAWPNFANHLFLEWSVLLFWMICRNDQALGSKSIRWLTVIVFFYTGFQKLAMGQYFEGQFLLVRVAKSPKFRMFFELLLSDAEVARLVAMGARFGTGPYTTSDALFLLISNSIWIGEIAIAILLLVPKWRKFALFGGILMLSGVELGARELVFGALFTILLLLFYPGRNAISLWPLFAAVQAASVATRLLIPDLKFN